MEREEPLGGFKERGAVLMVVVIGGQMGRAKWAGPRHGDFGSRHGMARAR